MTNRWTLAAVAAGSIVATLAVGGAALAARDHGLGPLGHVDANDDGKVTRAEWLAAANARFAEIDRNGDGTLIVGELPPPHAGPGPGRGRHHHRDDWDDEGPDAPAPTTVAPLTDQAPAATNTTAK